MRNRRARATPRGATRGQTSEALSEFTLHFLLRAAGDLRLGHEHQVPGHAGATFVSSVALPEQPLGPIPLDRSAHAATHGQAEPVVALIIPRRNHEKERPVDAYAPPEQPTEVRGGSDPLAPSEPGSETPGRPTFQAPSLFRPFWRRRLSTRRPPFVRMRTRKPCVRRRFRLFGWNVRFIVGSPSTGQRR